MTNPADLPGTQGFPRAPAGLTPGQAQASRLPVTCPLSFQSKTQVRPVAASMRAGSGGGGGVEEGLFGRQKTLRNGSSLPALLEFGVFLGGGAQGNPSLC